MNSKLDKIFNSKSADCILVTSPESMRYLSGFEGGAGCLLIMRDNKYLLTDSRYTLMAENQAEGFKIVRVDGEYSASINEISNRNNVSVIGFENVRISYSFYNDLKKALSDVVLKPIDTVLDDLRSVKTEQEIQYIHAAEKTGDIVFEKILGDIKSGVTEIETAAKIEYYLKTHGGEAVAFDTIVASGRNSAMPHAVPTHKKIMPGDFITMDFGCKVNGYCSDMTRTVVLGRADDEQKKIYQTVLDAQQRALDAARAGMTGAALDCVAREYIDNSCYKNRFGHGLGHGLGLAVHEEPRVSMRNGDVLPEKCVVTIEPGIYIDGLYGVRIEDVVVLEKNGSINLTGAGKSLIEL